jgi:hypothetical protein
MTTHLNRSITRAAPVKLYNESHGLFGELIDPQVVLQALRMSDNVGKLDDPGSAEAVQALHSFSCSEAADVVVEFDNITNYTIQVRWMDERGNNTPNSRWNVYPLSSIVRLARPGHLFVVTVLLESSSSSSSSHGEEMLFGAYRVRMSLPSGSPHCIIVEQQHDGAAEDSLFFFQAILTDDTDQDTLVVAAEALDPVGAGSNHSALEKTISSLSTICNNILQNPADNKKFRSLRVLNPKVQQQIVASWGAMHLLHILGFQETLDGHYLTLKEEAPNNPHHHHKSLERAAQLLEQLHLRSKPGFVAEVAPIPPWHGPVLTSSFRAHTFSTRGSNFLTEDERWNRTERNVGRRGRRGGGGHRPFNRGSAPSSNGAWGR